MNPEDLKKILDALSAADVREFQLKTGSFDLSLQRGPVSASYGTQPPVQSVQPIQPIQQVPLPPVAPIAPVAPVSAAMPMPTAVSPMPQQAVETSAATLTEPHAAPTATTTTEVKETAQASTETTAESASNTAGTSTGTPVKAPIVGTFYAASSPDAAPYVKVGDQVSAGQILCIIEAMKLMNEIEAETSGVIKEILISNAEPVEYGQTLFIIE